MFGPVIETAYGRVEAPQIVAAMRASELAHDENLASVGRPSSVAEVAIMSPSGELRPNGETGEIVVRGPLVMNGYLDRPDMTAETTISMAGCTRVTSARSTTAATSSSAAACAR